MPEPKSDLQTLMRREDVLAVVLPAGEVFGLLQRRFDLPPYWAALAISTHGGKIAYPAGSEVSGEDAEEIMLVRTNTLALDFEFDQLTSKDEFPCRVCLTLRFQVIPEQSELSAFRESMARNKEVVQVSDLQNALRSAVCEGVKRFVASRDMGDLVKGLDQSGLFKSIQTQVSSLVFDSGLSVANLPSAVVDSKTFRQYKQQRVELERRREQEHAQAQLQQAIRNSQDAHLSHLRELLHQLKTLGDESPQAEFADLLKAFGETQRGELYQALWSAEQGVSPTQWIVVASGQDLLYFDPAFLDKPSKTFSLESPVGALRSVSFCVDGDGNGLLLVGAARGAHVVQANSDQVMGTYDVSWESEKPLRGGFNAVALAGEHLFATHSELGLRRWSIERPEESSSVLSDLTRSAQAVRHVQFASGKIWFSIDNDVYSMPVGGPVGTSQDRGSHPEGTHPEGCGLGVYRGSGAFISALACTDSALFAGNAAGEILRWKTARPDQPMIIYRGDNRPVESVCILPAGVIDRLFFTDTSANLHAQVIGDAFACRYQAGGQTIRRAEVGPDWIAAMNENRDRLFCWRTRQPSAPPTIIPVAQLTGRSIQDVCLVPQVI